MNLKNELNKIKNILVMLKKSGQAINTIQPPYQGVIDEYNKLYKELPITISTLKKIMKPFQQSSPSVINPLSQTSP